MIELFKIICPNCKEEFNLTKTQSLENVYNAIYFNEIKVCDYDYHTKLSCPNCNYYESDMYEGDG